MKPVISEDANRFLLERMKRPTDDQWKDLYRLAQADRATGHSADEWLEAIKAKISEMESAKCTPMSEGKSVLSH